MLGDSITAHAASLYPDAWADAFEGLDALPLGGYGNSVHKLAWRLLVRRPEVDPPTRIAGRC